MLAAIMLLAPAAASCGAQGEEFEARPSPHPLVDNLYIERRAGDSSPMSLANGRFRLTGRCLTVNIGEADLTPIFALAGGAIAPSPRGLSRGDGHPIDYGVLYALPGAVPGPRLEPGAALGCPLDTLVIRGIDRLQDLPEPKMPPLTPEPR
jgi:hypothetical protein